MRLFTRQLI